MKLSCNVCMHQCKFEEGQLGRCRARKHVGDSIISTNYGKITSIALDPIEKKPLYHFYPGSKVLSVGSFGCNLTCPFCQNYQISMAKEEEVDYMQLSPIELVRKAESLRGSGNIGVAFTYNEPLIGYEFVRDTAKLLKEADMRVVVVTNGCISLEVAKEVLPYVDALNIDLKGFTKEYYQFIGGDFEMAKAFIEEAAKECHVELTTLVIPGKNDSEEAMREMTKWIADIDPEIPLHLSRFFPAWKLQDVPPTKVQAIYDLVGVAKERLKYVYAGNC